MTGRFVIAVVFLGACISLNGSGGNGSADGAGGSGSGPGSSGANHGSGSGGSTVSTGTGVALTIDSVTTPPTINDATPTSGSFFFLVSVEMANLGGSALPTDTNYFTALTDQQVAYNDAGPQPTDDPCGSDVTVEAGGYLECDVSFQVLQGLWPTTLRYNDGHGDFATVDLPPPPMASASCSELEQWIADPSLSMACISCVNSASCQTSGQAYVSACGSCETACSSGTQPDICACEESCDSTSCQALWNDYTTCLVSTCASMCP